MIAAGLRLSALGLLAACATGPPEYTWRPETPIAWPEPLARPRVELELAYRSTADVHVPEGFFRRLWTLLVGRSQEALRAPHGMAIGAGGRLLIADTARGVVHSLDLSTGEHVVHGGPPDDPMRTPVAVAAVPYGRVFVSDSSLGRLWVLSPEGDVLGRIGGPELLGRPTGLAYDAAHGRLLVVDTTGGRILGLDLDGELRDVYGERGEEAGELNYPTNIAVDPSGRIFVTDSLNFRIQVLSPDGEHLGGFGIPGSGPGSFAKPKGIALDSQGHVYVVDGMFDNVQIFDQEGTLLLTMCRGGGGLGELFLPTGILIDDEDRIFVSDSGNSRIQVFQFHPAAP